MTFFMYICFYLLFFCSYFTKKKMISFVDTLIILMVLMTFFI